MDYENTDMIDLTPDTSGADTNGLDAGLTEGRTNETFKAELARALQVVAGQERDRRIASIGADAERQVERTRSRGAVESEELRRSADEDASAIRAWSKAEIEKIRSEAARRAQQREADLRNVLSRHEAIIEVEVSAVASAVQGYETTLVEFFEDMTHSMDLAHIVRQSDLIPAPPNLEIVRADARADTAAYLSNEDAAIDDTDEPTDESADGPWVGVMDADAIGTTADGREAASTSMWEADDAPVAEESADDADVDGVASQEPIAVASTNGADGHENPATRFLRSLGWSSAAAESGSQTDQPR